MTNSNLDQSLSFREKNKMLPKRRSGSTLDEHASTETASLTGKYFSTSGKFTKPIRIQAMRVRKETPTMNGTKQPLILSANCWMGACDWKGRPTVRLDSQIHCTKNALTVKCLFLMILKTFWFKALLLNQRPTRGLSKTSKGTSWNYLK